MKKFGIFVICSGMLLACEQPTTPTQNQSPTPQQTTNAPTISSVAISTQPIPSKPKTIHWQKIDSGEKAIDPNTFKYAFDIDSEVVKMYAKEYNIDHAAARYHMTVGMAINEVLSKLLDELDTSYTSHEIVIDKITHMPILIVHTTKDVENFSADYVFSEKFAKGLSIKVQIINDGIKKPITNPHSES